MSRNNSLILSDAALASALNPDALGKLQERVINFQRKNFAGQPLAGKLEHMRREVIELMENPDDLSEWADVLLLLIGAANLVGLTAADLIAAGHAKMDVNDKRKWSPADEHGVYHHLE